MSNIEQLFFDFQKKDEKLSKKERRKIGNPYEDLVNNITDLTIAELPDCLINLICYNSFPPERWNALNKEDKLRRLYQITYTFPWATNEVSAKSLGMLLASILINEQKNIDKLFKERNINNE
ncbi:MAG: hypothetical protein PHE89_02810 [Alphaproteobacteria bacterium]|nr:hypothetical protein [Alphaproteobacteria bacterium]